MQASACLYMYVHVYICVHNVYVIECMSPSIYLPLYMHRCTNMRLCFFVCSAIGACVSPKFVCCLCWFSRSTGAGSLLVYLSYLSRNDYSMEQATYWERGLWKVVWFHALDMEKIAPSWFRSCGKISSHRAYVRIYFTQYKNYLFIIVAYKESA